jgi:hypothetical protein
VDITRSPYIEGSDNETGEKQVEWGVKQRKCGAFPRGAERPAFGQLRTAFDVAGGERAEGPSHFAWCQLSKVTGVEGLQPGGDARVGKIVSRHQELVAIREGWIKLDVECCPTTEHLAGNEVILTAVESDGEQWQDRGCAG